MRSSKYVIKTITKVGLLLTFFLLLRCAKPIDPKLEYINIAPDVDRNTNYQTTIGWNSDEPAMGIVEFAVDTNKITHYLYDAKNKYNLEHNLTVIDAPEFPFYYRIRLIYENGDVQKTNFQYFKQEPLIEKGSYLRIVMVDVGFGDCIYMMTPDGNTVMFDAGDRNADTNILNSLQYYGLSEIDYFIGTHDHADHMGGFSNLFDVIPVHNFIMPDATVRDYYFSDAIQDVVNAGGSSFETSRGHSSNVYDYLQWDSNFTVTVFSAGTGAEFGNDENNDSPLIKVEYDNFSIMLGGDSENDVHTKYIVNNPVANPEVDVLKASHHGRTDGTDGNFMDALQAQTVLISTVDDGTCNGLFQCASLSIFHNANTDVFRTDCASPELNRTNPNKKMNADLVVTTDGRYYSITLN